MINFFNFIVSSDILMENQSCFRPDHSCETSLNWLIMNFKEQRHEGNIIIAVFLDFQRAFETVDREILLEKLSKYGVKDIEHQWFKSYLNNRTQRTKIGSAFSTIAQTTFGVPQGPHLVHCCSCYTLMKSSKYLNIARSHCLQMMPYCLCVIKT